MSVISAVAFFLAVAVTCEADPTLVTLKHPLVPAEYLQNVEYLPPKPYEFGYEFADGFGMTQHRREVADSLGAVKGSYGYRAPDGTFRQVDYTADGNGYNANIKTNELGLSTSGQSSANAQYSVQVPTAAAVAQGLRPIVPKILI